jgi:hypothetical protein
VAAVITPGARRVLPALTLGAVLVLGSACGSGPTSGSASAASSAPGSVASSSSAASPSAPSDAELKDAFCTQAPALLQKVNTERAGVQSAPQTAPQVLADAVTQLNTLPPPAGVAAQWHRFVGAVTALRDLIAKLDLNNPQANAQYAGQVEALRPDLVDGGAAIDDWGKANC